MSGSIYDGVLRKRLEAHCRNCGEAALGLNGHHDFAKAELRSMGWGTRNQLWCCWRCLPILPRGHKFDDDQPARKDAASEGGER